jgi:hypothetical protein
MLFVLNKRILVYFIVFSAAVFYSQAQNDSLDATRKKQEEEKRDWLSKDRFYWGGNVGAWIGNPTFVDVSPLVGYMVTPKLGIGLGGIYNYYSYRYGPYQYAVNFYGGRINARYFIFENVFLQGGWDRINRDNPYSTMPNARIWIDNLLVGGGFRYAIGNNFYAMASGLWNLNQGPLSPYPNPILQIGFAGGF